MFTLTHRERESAPFQKRSRERRRDTESERKRLTGKAPSSAVWEILTAAKLVEFFLFLLPFRGSNVWAEVCLEGRQQQVKEASRSGRSGGVGVAGNVRSLSHQSLFGVCVCIDTRASE